MSNSTKLSTRREDLLQRVEGITDLAAHEKIMREKVNDCYWGRYKFCVAGVGLGMVHSIAYKTHMGYVVGGMVGTMADMAEAMVECKRLTLDLDLYLEAKDFVDQEKKRGEAEHLNA